MISSCKVYIDVQEYSGEYNIENENLCVDIYDYFNDTEEDDFSGNKEMIICDYRNNQYFYSSTFSCCKKAYGMAQYETFQTNFYLNTSRYENIENFSFDFKVKSLTFYHPLFINFFSNKALKTKQFDDKIEVTLKTKYDPKQVLIQKNNIEFISFGEIFSYKRKREKRQLVIETENHVKLSLMEPISFENILSYINEFDIIVNSYLPTGSDTKGKRIDFLTVADDLSLFVKSMDTLFHTGEHLTGTHSHVIDSLCRSIFARKICIHGKQVTHACLTLIDDKLIQFDTDTTEIKDEIIDTEEPADPSEPGEEPDEPSTEPGNPEEPDNSENPDNPDNPDVPDEPVEPEPPKPTFDEISGDTVVGRMYICSEIVFLGHSWIYIESTFDGEMQVGGYTVAPFDIKSKDLRFLKYIFFFKIFYSLYFRNYKIIISLV